MANLQKYNRFAAAKILGHNARQHGTYSNHDVDLSRSHENITYINHGYAGYKKRLSEVYCLNRKNVNTLGEVIVTQPKEVNRLAADQQDRLWREIIDFLSNRYGAANVIQAIVHKDEGGQPHLHFCFIPVVPDAKHGGEKVSFNDKCSRTDYRTFHRDLERHLNSCHDSPFLSSVFRPDPIRKVLRCQVGHLYHTGVTAAQGGNWDVKSVKHEQELNNLRCQLRATQYQLDVANQKIESLETIISQQELWQEQQVEQEQSLELTIKRQKEIEWEF